MNINNITSSICYKFKNVSNFSIYYDVVFYFLKLILMTEEFFFQCPYCWEEISMIFDKSLYEDSYIEDCEVCCNPIEIKYQSDGDDIINFSAISIEQ